MNKKNSRLLTPTNPTKRWLKNEYINSESNEKIYKKKLNDFHHQFYTILHDDEKSVPKS